MMSTCVRTTETCAWIFSSSKSDVSRFEFHFLESTDMHTLVTISSAERRNTFEVIHFSGYRSWETFACKKTSSGTTLCLAFSHAKSFYLNHQRVAEPDTGKYRCCVPVAFFLSWCVWEQDVMYFQQKLLLRNSAFAMHCERTRASWNSRPSTRVDFRTESAKVTLIPAARAREDQNWCLFHLSG